MNRTFRAHHVFSRAPRSINRKKEAKHWIEKIPLRKGHEMSDNSLSSRSTSFLVKRGSKGSSAEASDMPLSFLAQEPSDSILQ